MKVNEFRCKDRRAEKRNAEQFVINRLLNIYLWIYLNGRKHLNIAERC